MIRTTGDILAAEPALHSSEKFALSALVRFFPEIRATFFKDLH